MATIVIPLCPVCKSVKLRDHCERRACGWWRCRSCGSFGDAGRYVRMGKGKA